MNKSIFFSVILIFSFLLGGCKSEKKSDLPTLDLMSYGVPISIKAPEGAEVIAEDFGIMKDVTVKGEGNYFVQISGSLATELDLTKIKQEQLDLVKEGPFFSKIVEDYENGFVFEKKVDSRVNYDFRYIKLQGDDLYIYQTGMMGKFSEEEVKGMYESVK